MGTGFGDQAIALAAMGFEVTATDASTSAISVAEKQAKIKNVLINFVVDKMLMTQLIGSFDIIIDRGCASMNAESALPVYFDNLKKLLKTGGWLLIKADTRKSLKSMRGTSPIKLVQRKKTSYQRHDDTNVDAMFFAMRNDG